MKKLFAVAVCAVALVGCGGPIDENDTTGQNQQLLVQPDGIPTESKLDSTLLNLDQQSVIQARQAQFADSYVWGVTERPHHCGK
jgi:hypothetical protein